MALLQLESDGLGGARVRSREVLMYRVKQRICCHHPWTESLRRWWPG